jgi:hypothetical protein
MPQIQTQYHMINNNKVVIWQWQQHKHHQVKTVLSIIFFSFDGACSIEKKKNWIFL